MKSIKIEKSTGDDLPPYKVIESWMQQSSKYSFTPNILQDLLFSHFRESKISNTEGLVILPQISFYILDKVTLFGHKNFRSNLLEDKKSVSEYIIPGIHENDIRQGFIGDCYFLVCLMALAKNEKTFIQNHLDITHNQQGFPESFNVKLYNKDGQIPDPNNPKIKIPINDFLTHGVAQANVTCDYDDENRVEIWPQVYEKAWACVRTDTKKFGAIDGGNAAVVWPFLTGKKVPNDKQIYYELTEKKRR